MSFDRIYPSAYEMQAKMIAELIYCGYGDKVLVSHDYSAFLDFGNADFEEQKTWDRDFTTVHKKLFPTLKKLGVQDKEIKKLTIDNPKKVLFRSE